MYYYTTILHTIYIAGTTTLLYTNALYHTGTYTLTTILRYTKINYSILLLYYSIV